MGVIKHSKRKTPSIQNEPNPRWDNLEFIFREYEDNNRNKAKEAYQATVSAIGLHSRQHLENYWDHTLQATVYDANRFSRRTFCGKIEIQLQDLVPVGHADVTLPLLKSKDSDDE